MRTIEIIEQIRCPFSAAIDYAEMFHQEQAAAGVPYAQIVRSVHCAANEIRDVTDETRVHEALIFRWSSHVPVLPPILHGLITVRPNGRTTQLRLEATYVARFGLIGHVIDSLCGRLVVRKMLYTFARQLCRYIENRYDMERSLALGVFKSSY